jgi:glycosyltransferase involved in cell wall biosynthesis
MSEILYVSRSPVYDHIVNSHLTIGHNITILAPWNPSSFTRKILKLPFFPRSFSDIFLTRPKQIFEISENSEVQKINFGFWEFAGLIFSRLDLFGYASRICVYSEKRVLRKAQGFVRRFKYVIVTDDFLACNLDLIGKRIVVEVRGGLFLNFNSIRDISKFPINLYHDLQFTTLSQPLTKEKIIKATKNLYNVSEFITYSELYKQLVEKAAPGKKVWIIPLKFPIYDLPEPQKSISGTHTLLFVGRDEPIKGLDIAINIAVNLNLPIKIVGNYSRSMIEILSAIENVDVVGSINRGKLFNLMKSSSILIAPSIETFGYSILESLQLGTPVLTSRFAGVTEWLKDEKMLHVMDGFDLQSWSARVEHILKNSTFPPNDPTIFSRHFKRRSDEF